MAWIYIIAFQLYRSLSFNKLAHYTCTSRSARCDSGTPATVITLQESLAAPGVGAPVGQAILHLRDDPPIGEDERFLVEHGHAMKRAPCPVRPPHRHGR